MARGSRGWTAPYALRVGAAAVVLVAAAAGVAGCGNEQVYRTASTHTTATPAPAALTLAKVRADLRRMGFDLYDTDRMPAGPLRAFRGIWHEAGDGGVQNIFFYEGDRFVGVARDPNFRSAVIAAQDGHSAVVKQYIYRDSDPSCCPTGGTRDHTITWSNGKLMARTTGAPHPAPTVPPPNPDPS